MTTESKKQLTNGINYVVTKDNDGRVYHKLFLPNKIDLCLALNNNNYIIPMKINISLRNGQSKFGEQIVIQLVKDGNLTEVYRKKSPMEHIEFYLPKELGIIFLNHCIECFKARGNK